MKEYETVTSVCPNCGYDNNSPYDKMYLAPGTVLHNRYIVGVLLSFNGEGATYIAYDKSVDCKVLLREYMPLNLCSRMENSSVVSVNYNYLAKYKSFMAEFSDLNKSLAKLRNNASINQILDMFSENNTVYIISEYIEGCKLIDYLKDNAGELNWEQVAKLFPPLFTTIGIIHNEGIIHRAISPDTVYVTSKGEVKLSGFCISSVRTIGGGLEPELFKGYAAPEQYSSNTSSRQGTWTDVYGISALLYRMITGCMPAESVERLEIDNLCEPCILNPKIPKHVSRAIMDGLNVCSSNRIQTVTELVTRLFKPVDDEVKTYTRIQNINNNNNNSYDNTRTFTNEIPPKTYQQTDFYSNQRNYDEENQDIEDNGQGEEYEYEKVSTIDRIKIPLIIGILLFAILMILGITLMNVLSPHSEDDERSSSSYASMSDNIIEATIENPEETEPASEEKLDAVVPDLINKFYELTASKYEGFITLEPEYEYNNDYDEGQIFWQEFESGSLFHKGGTMKVKVSLGTSYVTIPDYSSCTVSEYETLLQNAKIKNYQFVEEDSYGYASPDTVIRLEINGNTVYSGDKIDNLKSEKLIVYYQPSVVTVAPEVTTAPETSATEIVTEPVTEPVSEEPATTETVPAETQPEEPVPAETNPPEESSDTEDSEIVE